MPSTLSAFLRKGLLNLIFPRNCLLCRHGLKNTSDILCLRCRSAVELNKPPFCQRCSRPLAAVREDNLCRQCRTTEYSFDSAFAAVIYNDCMQRLIHLFKYHNKGYLKNFFVFLMAQAAENYHFCFQKYDLLIPVPLSRARLRERGYNQSQLLAQDLSHRHGVRMSRQNLVRIRHTPNQALLRKKERWTNIRGALRIKNSAELKGKTILLLDDLLTTGATASEAARVLKKAGAASVDVLSLAIALDDKFLIYPHENP